MPRRFNRRFRRRRGKSNFLRKYGAIQGRNVYSFTRSLRSVSVQGLQLLEPPNTWDEVSSSNGTLGILFMGTPILERLRLLQQPVIVENPPTYNSTPSAGNYEGPDRYIIRSLTVEVNIVNQTSLGVWLELYYCVARRDIPASYSTPQVILTGGLSNQGNTMTATSPGCTPFNSQKWCQLWKIYKVKRIYLPTGASHHYKLTRKRDYVVDLNRYAIKSSYTGAISITQHTNALKGITKCVISRVWGNPDNDSASKALVTIGSAALDQTVVYTANTATISDPVHFNYETDTISNGYTESIMNEVTGAATTNVQA